MYRVVGKKNGSVCIAHQKSSKLLGRTRETKQVELGSGFSSSSLHVWPSFLFLFFLPLPHQGNSSRGNLGLYLSRILPPDKNQSSDLRE